MRENDHFQLFLLGLFLPEVLAIRVLKVEHPLVGVIREGMEILLRVVLVRQQLFPLKHMICLLLWRKSAWWLFLPLPPSFVPESLSFLRVLEAILSLLLNPILISPLFLNFVLSLLILPYQMPWFGIRSWNMHFKFALSHIMLFELIFIFWFGLKCKADCFGLFFARFIFYLRASLSFRVNLKMNSLGILL